MEEANNRLERSLESRAKTMDALLHEWKGDLVRIWLPTIAGAAMLIGLFAGMKIQGRQDSVSAATATPAQIAVPTVPSPAPQADGAAENSNEQHHSHTKAIAGARHER